VKNIPIQKPKKPVNEIIAARIKAMPIIIGCFDTIKTLPIIAFNAGNLPKIINGIDKHNRKLIRYVNSVPINSR
jgi:hypothetical protein